MTRGRRFAEVESEQVTDATRTCASGSTRVEALDRNHGNKDILCSCYFGFLGVKWPLIFFGRLTHHESRLIVYIYFVSVSNIFPAGEFIKIWSKYRRRTISDREYGTIKHCILPDPSYYRSFRARNPLLLEVQRHAPKDDVTFRSDITHLVSYDWSAI